MTIDKCAYNHQYFFTLQPRFHRSMFSTRMIEKLNEKPMRKTLEMFADLLLTLILIHDRKIIHGDMKPENIMATDDEVTEMVIIDFGLSMEFSDRSRCGTPEYVHPDFYLTKRNNNIADDYWALLISIFEMEFGLDLLEDNKYFKCINLNQQWGMYKPFDPNKNIVPHVRLEACLEILGRVIKDAFDSKKGKFDKDCGPKATQIYKSFFELMIKKDFLKMRNIAETLSDLLKNAIDECIEFTLDKNSSTATTSDLSKVDSPVKSKEGSWQKNLVKQEIKIQTSPKVKPVEHDELVNSDKPKKVAAIKREVVEESNEVKELNEETIRETQNFVINLRSSLLVENVNEEKGLNIQQGVRLQRQNHQLIKAILHMEGEKKFQRNAVQGDRVLKSPGKPGNIGAYLSPRKNPNLMQNLSPEKIKNLVPNLSPNKFGKEDKIKI